MTYTDLIEACQDAAGGDTSTASKTFFKQRLNIRYEQLLSFLPSKYTEVTRTFSTVAGQQYYYKPPSIRRIESIVVTIGSVDYPLDPINSQMEWDRFNAIDFQAGAIPSVYFERQRDFGIWPIPQGAYNSTIVYNLRNQPMVNEDYTTGTVAVSENSDTITGTTTSWDGNVFAGQWFSLTDSNGEPKGDWYRIESVGSDTSITLETVFENATASSQNYVIGDSPELPDEAHIMVRDGAVADYYAEKRQAPAKAQGWSNKFWTGDFNNNSRDIENVVSGALFIKKTYQDRTDSQIIKRKRMRQPNNYKQFATTISA